MRGGRILWGQIIVVFTIVLVMVWTSTQWVAFRLGFQPQLGNPRAQNSSESIRVYTTRIGDDLCASLRNPGKVRPDMHVHEI